MKGTKKYILLLLLFIFVPKHIYAYSNIIDKQCTTSIQSSIKESAYNIYYKYKMNSNYTFDIVFYNVDSSLIIKYQKKTYGNTISNIKSGTTLNIYFYGSNYCSEFKARTLTIKVPYYNLYQNDELCNGYENYYLCKEYLDDEITYDSFVKKMNSYISNINTNSETDVEPVHVGKTIYEILYENIILIYIALIIIVLYIIYLLYRRRQLKIYKDLN